MSLLVAKETVSQTNPILTLSHIDKSFSQGSEEVQILDDINFSLYPGETVAILGPSGSGKSTLLNILGLLSLQDSGQYLLDDIDTAGLSAGEIAALRLHKIAFVFQTFHLIDYKDVLSNVQLPLQYLGIDRSERQRLAENILTELGMSHRIHASVKTLSGGEKQRVAIARALVSSPRVLLCDEPTGSLDAARSRDVMHMLKSITGSEQTTVIVTHDSWVAEQCDRIFRISDGKLVEEVSQEGQYAQLSPSPISKSLKPQTPRKRIPWLSLSLGEAWNASIHRFRRNLFTILGVALGIASLVLTVGLTATISGQISAAFDVFLAKHVTLNQASQDPFTVQQATDLSKSPGIETVRNLNGVTGAAVVQSLSTNMPISSSQTADPTSSNSAPVLSTTPEIFSVQGQTLEAGRIFDAGHIQRTDRVAVVSKSLLTKMGLEFSPGITLYLSGTPFSVIGVVTENASLVDTLGAVYVPIGTELPGESPEKTSVAIATDPGAAEVVGSQAPAALNPARPNDFVAGIPPSPEGLKNAVSNSQQAMLIALSSVTLLIGAIGIMNTFLVAVMERRPEIGLRLALGMRPAGIIVQFATEAVLSSIIGTFIGILAAVNIIALVSMLNGWIPIINASTIGFGILAGILVGIIAGFYPAWKASRVDPVETLSA